MKSLDSESLLVIVLMCLPLMSMAAPTVSSISPTSGPTTGGTSVTITGTNFVSGAKVTFGGTAATGVSVVSSTTITATTPAMSAGTVPVTVTNPDGSSATLSSTNLLNNAGFESGSSFWKWNGSGSASVQTSASNAHSGSNYADLKATVGTHPVFFAANSAGSPLYFPVTPGDVITYGGWASRAAGDGLARYSIAVSDANKANPSYRTTTPSNVTGLTWVFQQGTYTVPAGKAFLLLYPEVFNNTVTAEARFDDAILQKGGGGFTYVATTGVGVSVSPRATSLTFTQTQQYTAKVTGTTNTSVSWSVDSIDGGNSTVGTISSSGFYTPPPNVGQHIITATSVADSTKKATASVVITDYAGNFTYMSDNSGTGQGMNSRTGQNVKELLLTPSNVNSAKFGKLTSYSVDGWVFGQPIYLSNVNFPGLGFRNLVFVATMHDSLYAFDADGKSSSYIWKQTFTNPTLGITSVPGADVGDGHLYPEIGIVGTPVVDPASNTIYVVVMTKESGAYFHRLHALDLFTRAEKFGGPVQITATISGSGAGSSGGKLTFNSQVQLNRPGLLLVNGNVYVAFGSYDDIGNYHGWLFAYDAQSLTTSPAVFNASKNTTADSIWQSGCGISADKNGDLFFATANGGFTVQNGGSSFANSVIHMRLISGTLAALDYFAPFNESTLNSNDLDLGSGCTTLLPDQSGTSHTQLSFTGGKEGNFFLLDRDNLGKYHSSDNNQAVQELFLGPAWSSPAYWNNLVFVGTNAHTLKAFRLSSGLLSGPVSQTARSFGYPGVTPVVSANGTSNGIVWILEKSSTNQDVFLHAYNATNLSSELYNSTQVASRDTIGAGTRFEIPLVANGRVYVGTGGSTPQLQIFGIIP